MEEARFEAIGDVLQYDLFLSGTDGAYVAACLLEHTDNLPYGYNTATHVCEDMNEIGIWDPADTLCTALHVGMEAAVTMLTVTAAVMKAE